MKKYDNKFQKMLTKKHLLILALLAMPLITLAQSREVKTFQLGFTASPNFGWLSFQSDDNTPNQKTDGLRPGFSYGLLGDFSFTDNYYFATAVTISTINANTTISDLSEYAYKLQYIEVPLTLKLKSNPKNGILYYGHFGLSTAVNIAAKQNYTNISSDIDAADFKNKNIQDDVNLLRVGLLFGGGAEWKLNQNLSLQTGLSYSNGFTDVLSTDAKAKNSYIALNLGIFF
ncbi:MAG: porin family protein [Daejeonella sp.]